MPKGFGYGGESAGQERKNLLKDNPVAKDASGGRSWMSKHSQSALRMDKPTPLKGHHSGDSAMKKYGAPMEKGHLNGSAMKKYGDSMAKMHTPFHKYDEVILGGNKGDKSKTKPGKKDYEK